MENNSPTITVIVPVYKVELYLHRCVDSILAQTFTDYELFLVDDGSPDNCGKICDEYAESDNRITVIHKENGGLSSARNAALDVMHGDYVCFVDSDDWIPSDSLQTMYDALMRTDADIAVGNMISVYDDGKREDAYCPVSEETVITGDAIFDMLCQPCAPNRLYPRRIYENLRFPVGKLYEDCFVFHLVLEQLNSVVLTGKENYYYYIRHDSIMHAKYSVRCMDIIDALDSRCSTLLRLGQNKWALDSMLFFYSSMSAAYANIADDDTIGQKRIAECKLIYNKYYPYLIKNKANSFKLKVCMTLLRYVPKLHKLVCGKKESNF